MKSTKFYLISCLTLLLLASNNLFASEKASKKSNSPWNLNELFQTPKFTMSEPKDGVVEVVYEAMNYHGATKEVFAYYSSPGTLSGDRSLDKNLPAVVCVHGGGGRAFDEWVKLWAQKGYAAISMDMRGFGAGGAQKGEELPRGFKEGEARKTPTYISFEPQSDDWFYQAIGDVITAHSLILSLPEVDTKRTAITGISWGGIMTTLVSGLDDRFKVAVPVYGCGYLFESGAMKPQIFNATKTVQERWQTLYDPSLYAGDARMPVFFVNGTNDHHFHTDQWQKSSDLPKKSFRSMRLKMPHGHNQGWAPEEIAEFIGSYLKKDEYPKTPQFTKLKCEDGVLSCKVKNLKEGSKAYILYTTHPTVAEEAQWVKKEAKIDGNVIVSTIGDDYRQCFLAVELPSGANYSSSIFFL